MELVQDIINMIMWDRRIISVPSDMSPFKELVIFNPTIEDRNVAYYAKRRLLKELQANPDLPSEESAFEDAKTNGYWTEQDELAIEEGEKYIAMLEADRSKKKLISQKKRIDEQITTIRQQMEKASVKKNEILSLTPQYLANEEFVFNLIFRTVKNTDGHPLFSTYEEIMNMRRDQPGFLSMLMREVITEGLFPQTDLRRVARSVDWRMLWTLHRENLSALFGIPLYNLSYNQKMLIYWSRVYDIAFESTEKPDDQIIENDDKFDEWLNTRNTNTPDIKTTSTDNAHELGVVLDGYYMDTCTCGVGTTRVQGHGEHIPHEPNCTWGKFKRYTKEEKAERARQVYSRNNPRIRTLINAEHDVVSNVGAIDEKDLRKGKSRLVLGSKQNIQDIRK